MEVTIIQSFLFICAIALVGGILLQFLLSNIGKTKSSIDASIKGLRVWHTTTTQ